MHRISRPTPASIKQRQPQHVSVADTLEDTALSLGKVALVTGASAGIGAATALRLASDGFTVYGVARRADLLNDLAGVRPIQADITNDAQRRDCVNRVLDETGRIDVLVNNAGSGLYGALEDIPLETAQKLFEVNLFAHARLIQLFLPTFREQGKGTIMNVSSIAGRIYAPFGCWYHASKFALEGLSDSLRIELRPYGVRVVLIEPGAIDTDGLRGAGESLRSNSGSTSYSPPGPTQQHAQWGN